MILGAFGTHLMRGRLTPERLYAWDAASSYSIYNGLGLLIATAHPRLSTRTFGLWAVLIGALVFSGSIVLLVVFPTLRFLGPITPIGGMGMIVGYFSLAL